uniref:Uncharacterized protein n=1 Tax=Globisporangium ultimum (strain ATCC 200006 / CBS 805.95 / DAOM BR144) TaxID=431595 RepID=K3WQN2_GLOUD
MLSPVSEHFCSRQSMRDSTVTVVPSWTSSITSIDADRSLKYTREFSSIATESWICDEYPAPGQKTPTCLVLSHAISWSASKLRSSRSSYKKIDVYFFITWPLPTSISPEPSSRRSSWRTTTWSSSTNVREPSCSSLTFA